MSDLARFRPPPSQARERISRHPEPKGKLAQPLEREEDAAAEDPSTPPLEYGRGKESWFFLKSSIGFLGGALLCLVAAIVLLLLDSPRVGMDLPWADTALDVLGFSVVALGGAHLFLKALALLTDRHGKPRRPKKGGS